MATATQFDDMSDEELAEAAFAEAAFSEYPVFFGALGRRIIDLTSEVGKLQYLLDKKET